MKNPENYSNKFMNHEIIIERYHAFEMIHDRIHDLGFEMEEDGNKFEYYVDQEDSMGILFY